MASRNKFSFTSRCILNVEALREVPVNSTDAENDIQISSRRVGLRDGNEDGELEGCEVGLDGLKLTLGMTVGKRVERVGNLEGPLVGLYDGASDG